jgi:hypothetical protein
MIFLAVLLGMLLAVILTAPPGQRQQVPEMKRKGHRDLTRWPFCLWVSAGN